MLAPLSIDDPAEGPRPAEVDLQVLAGLLGRPVDHRVEASSSTAAGGVSPVGSAVAVAPSSASRSQPSSQRPACAAR